MNYYECVFIINGELEEDGAGQVAESIKEQIEKEGGSILKTDNWGKKRLAYRVKKQRYGFYILNHIEIPGDKVKTLEWNFKLSENILKHFILRIDKKELEAQTKPVETVATDGGDVAAEEAASE